MASGQGFDPKPKAEKPLAPPRPPVSPVSPVARTISGIPDGSPTPSAEQISRAEDEGLAKFGITRPSDVPSSSKAEPAELLSVVPRGLQDGIEFILIGGGGLSVAVLLVSGLGIFAEAFLATKGTEVSQTVTDFLAFCESACTPSLIITLGFSVMLGLWKTVQMGSSTSSGMAYREDD